MLLIPECLMRRISVSSWLLTRCKRSCATLRSVCSSSSQEVSVESVINDENKKKCISRFQRMPSIRMKDGEIPAKSAAVLVPLCIVDNRISLIYTVRSRTMSKNAGQVSFPGGMMDATDRNLVETAIRETHEELGINKEAVDVWCTGKYIGTWDRSMGVMPVVGFLGEIDLGGLKTNPKEVEEVFAVPLQEFCDPNNGTYYTKFLRGYCLPVYIYKGHHIWGLTATITHILLSALLGDKYTRQHGKLLRFFSKVNK